MPRSETSRPYTPSVTSWRGRGSAKVYRAGAMLAVLLFTLIAFAIQTAAGNESVLTGVLMAVAVGLYLRLLWQVEVRKARISAL